MKYSINSSGNIVAERDIYSLGGFIPKGSVGAKVANEDQISQDGECWVAGGDISGRPDVRVKDNAYIGTFTAGLDPVHTDGITEFSGNTLIPGNILVRSLVEDTKNNFFAKDSFIGVSVKSLCGPRTTTTAFPFEQGGYLSTASRGTAFSSSAIQTQDISLCRSTDASIRCGLNTYVYLPTGYSGTILWAYTQGGTAVYSGESKVIPSGLTKIEHPVYKQFMLHIGKIDGTAMTPTDLLATGAKILGHISGSALTDIRPESASGQYVMNNSYLIVNTSNFGLAATQKRILAGGLFNSTMYTPDDRAEYKIFGTFHNVQRLEYTMYLSDSHRTNVNRDRYISAYDCPLLRVDNTTYISFTGDLVLRRCIVPKAMFTDNIHNGNVYEDIDFSYTSDHLGAKAGNNYDMWSSHKQGEYAAIGAGTAIAGLISRPENLAAGSILGPGVDSVPLDGSLLEQGAYGGGSQIPYESAKSASAIRIRTGKPVKTAGLIFPSLPAGYSVKAFYYLDEDFIIRSTSTDPTGLDATYPYVVMLFRRDDDSSITVADFLALGLSLRITNYSNVPEITGSSYVGAGCAVRGDVKLIGDPYVNRVFDVNLWERGTTRDGVLPDYPTWDSRKIPTGVGNRFRIIDTVPVEPGAKITCNSGFWITCYFFDANGNYLSSPGWGRIANTAPANSAFVGIIIKKAAAAADAGELIDESDIPLANVKYVRSFKKRRYIVNELDRTSPEDILLIVDYWEQGTAGGGQADAGKTYEELKAASGTTIRLKRPINVSPTSSISSAPGFSRCIRVLDAVTKFHLGESLASAKMALLATIIQKDPSAAIDPSEIPNSRLVLEFVPQPRIIVPYGVSNVWIEGTKVRMYDNSVISRTITKDMGVILKGDAVMGSVFTGDVCMCSNGHGDAIINK